MLSFFGFGCNAIGEGDRPWLFRIGQESSFSVTMRRNLLGGRLASFPSLHSIAFDLLAISPRAKICLRSLINKTNPRRAVLAHICFLSNRIFFFSEGAESRHGCGCGIDQWAGDWRAEKQRRIGAHARLEGEDQKNRSTAPTISKDVAQQ